MNRGAILHQVAAVAAALAMVLLVGAGCARESQGQSDLMTPELRQRVDALRSEARTVPTNVDNLAERLEVLWQWTNALARAGHHIPESLPADIAIAGFFIAEKGKPTGGSEITTDEMCRGLDRSVRELELIETQPDAFGTFRAASDAVLAARAWSSIDLIYTVGSLGVAEGGSFLIAIQYQSDAGTIQIDKPTADNYASVESSNPNVRLTPMTGSLTGLHGGNREARATPGFRVEGAALAPGETVTFHIGDRRSGSRGLEMQTNSTDDFKIPIYLDLEGRGQYFGPEWPVFRVEGGQLTRLTVLAPSVVGAGETFDLTVRAEDYYLNRATSPIPTWEVLLDGKPLRQVPVGGAALQLVEQLSVAAAGVHRFTVRSADGKLSAISNPVWVRDRPAQRVLWGETHGHTGLAEGQGSAGSYFRYGIEDARMDFLTLSEHDMFMDDAEWKLLDDLTRRTNAGNRTVSFLGYEWTTTRDLGGHHNVFFRNPGRPRVAVQTAPTLEQLYAGLKAAEREADVLVIPHAHVAGDWRKNDAGMERLVEIASNHGTFEWFGNKYLQNGFKVGFIAAADDHRARPGRTGTKTEVGQTGGLAAVLAPEKTSDAIFDALRARTTYATSGERIILDATANGRPPGSDLKAEGKLEIACKVMGTAPIDQIDVIKNGEVAFSRSYLTAPLTSRVWVQVSFESSSAVYGEALDNPRAYRPWKGTLRVDGARVLQVKPAFVNEYRAKAKIDEKDPALIHFQTETRGRRDVMLIELDGATSTTAFHVALEPARERRAAPPLVRPMTEIPATEVTLSFDRMADGRLEQPVPVDVHPDRILLQTVNPDAPLDREFEWSDLGKVEAGDYVYLRVTQLDGSRAWSSPFYFGW